MKLYLSSYKIGNRKFELEKWLETSTNNKIFLITNSRDAFPDGERKVRGIESDTKELDDLGFDVELLDLRKYFGKKEQLKYDLKDIHAFYAVGGNTFVLRKAMKLSGFDELLIEYSCNPEYLYEGYSAGICCLCKDIKAIAIMDNPKVDPYDCGLPPIYEGLGLVNPVLIPHFESDHKETKAASKAVKYCQENKISYTTLHDGEVLIY